MSSRDGSEVPIAVFEVNGNFILGIYKGTFSKFDILIRYRQKINHSWSRIRTPKHIHWAVDILIKLHEDRKKTQQFLNFLLNIWQKTEPIPNEHSRKSSLKLDALLRDSKRAVEKYKELGKKGEYSIKFLILLAKLLMIQEKTNRKDAYMFRKLLEALETGRDIFSIVSIASHTSRK